MIARWGGPCPVVSSQVRTEKNTELCGWRVRLAEPPPRKAEGAVASFLSGMLLRVVLVGATDRAGLRWFNCENNTTCPIGSCWPWCWRKMRYDWRIRSWGGLSSGYGR